jgi:excisionase family DNA binding protein
MITQQSADGTDAPTPVSHGGNHAPALLTINDAVQVLRLSRSVIYEQIKAGRLRTVRQGRATRITAAAIAEYIRLLEAESAETSV